MPIDPRELRQALGCFATGITVITTRDPLQDQPIGITANSFNAVSLDPPLVLFSLARGAYSLQAFLEAGHFAVNVLSDHQGELSGRFARTSSDKWRGLAYEDWGSGCPILSGCAANFDCRTRYTHDGGDHVIFVGEVLQMACHPENEPLLYYQGRYRHLAKDAL